MEGRGFIAVHLGAGYHSHSKEKLYKALCRQSLDHGMSLIKNGEAASRVVSAVVSILEDSPLTNAGVGSNLTVEGKVECDAGMMEGSSGLFSGIGAIANVKNPIRVAEELLCYQKENREGSELVPPILLVGEGATDFAASQEIEIIDGDFMVTDTALKTYERCHFRLQEASARMKLHNGLVEGKKRKHFEAESESNSSYSDGEQCLLYSSDGTVDFAFEKSHGMDSSRAVDWGEKYKRPRVARPRYKMKNREARLLSSYFISNQSDNSDFTNDCRQGAGGKDNVEQSYFDPVQYLTKRKDKLEFEARYDTVGVICVDSTGASCSGISSGGLILKLPGRVGHAAIFGSGCWASTDDSSSVSTASCTSGCGEQILRTFLAKECCDFLESAVDDEMLNPSSFFKRKFLNSKQLKGEEEKLAGVIGLVFKRKSPRRSNRGNRSGSLRRSLGGEKDKTGSQTNQGGNDEGEPASTDDVTKSNHNAEASVESSDNQAFSKKGGPSDKTDSDHAESEQLSTSLDFMIAHSTNSFCVGFWGGSDAFPTVMISRMPSADLIGKSVSGHVFHYDW